MFYATSVFISWSYKDYSGNFKVK